MAGILPEYDGEEWGALKIEEYVQGLMASGQYEPDSPTVANKTAKV
jgi:hypothetical protein